MATVQEHIESLIGKLQVQNIALGVQNNELAERLGNLEKELAEKTAQIAMVESGPG